MPLILLRRRLRRPQVKRWAVLTKRRATGTLARSLAAFATTATGKLLIKATSARTLDNFTLAGVASHGQITGTLARALAAFNTTATGKLWNRGTLTRTLANATLAATGREIDHGALAQTMANFTLAATGILSTTRTATLNRTLDNFALAGIGNDGESPAGGGGNASSFLQPFMPSFVQPFVR